MPTRIHDEVHYTQAELEEAPPGELARAIGAARAMLADQLLPRRRPVVWPGMVQPPRNPQDYIDPRNGGNVRFTVAGTEMRARQRGQVIEHANPHTLQLDIDGHEAYEKFEKMLELWDSCPQLPRLGRIVERDSRTPGNQHITITLDADFTVEQRILFQALLGSDLKREMLSLASHLNGHANPILFFRNPENSNAETPRSGDGTDSAGLNSASDNTQQWSEL